MEAGHFLLVANCVYENMSVSEMGRPRKPGTRNLYSRERMADSWKPMERSRELSLLDTEWGGTESQVVDDIGELSTGRKFISPELPWS